LRSLSTMTFSARKLYIKKFGVVWSLPRNTQSSARHVRMFPQVGRDTRAKDIQIDWQRLGWCHPYVCPQYFSSIRVLRVYSSAIHDSPANTCRSCDQEDQAVLLDIFVSDFHYMSSKSYPFTHHNDPCLGSTSSDLRYVQSAVVDPN
jgi:hypothetical protein